MDPRGPAHHAAPGTRLRPGIHPLLPARAPTGPAALRGLLDAVAPGGTLLFATHTLADLARHRQEGFDPADYYQPDDIARLLDPTWNIMVNETRPGPLRRLPAPTTPTTPY